MDVSHVLRSAEAQVGTFEGILERGREEKKKNPFSWFLLKKGEKRVMLKHPFDYSISAGHVLNTSLGEHRRSRFLPLRMPSEIKALVLSYEGTRSTPLTRRLNFHLCFLSSEINKYACGLSRREKGLSATQKKGKMFIYKCA
ncbi:hypothetical protein CDAR_552401 [Caerostris darwini]|uniref:Uncharacterized protein n=1 Tax=Caerostris darwini TaxID=1538125 RepID=A0AAV4NN73_9ARAC|nr:hypothetical protein CDAR_552401 [Caerostris darwini]